MPRGLNRAQIIGNLGRDPEVRHTDSAPVATFSVAVNRTRRDPAGGTVEETEWFRVTAWDKLAEICERYLRKGSAVYVEGRLHSRRYTGRDGVERTAVEIVAGDLLLLDRRAASAEGPGTPATAAAHDDLDGDELPF